MRSLLSAVLVLMLNLIPYLPAAAEQLVVTDQAPVAASAVATAAVTVSPSELTKKERR